MPPLRFSSFLLFNSVNVSFCSARPNRIHSHSSFFGTDPMERGHWRNACWRSPFYSAVLRFASIDRCVLATHSCKPLCFTVHPFGSVSEWSRSKDSDRPVSDCRLPTVCFRSSFDCRPSTNGTNLPSWQLQRRPDAPPIGTRSIAFTPLRFPYAVYLTRTHLVFFKPRNR
jgi:hypothetical protein